MPAENIIDLLASSTGPTFSVEFFPPSDDAGVQQLLGALEALQPLEPDWVSVTYGATGASRYKTFSAVGALRGQTATSLIGHLTIAGQSKSDVVRAIEAYERLGVTHILALRGDPPRGESFVPHPEGLTSATELVTLIKSLGDFTVGVAAFPDGHPESTLELDAEILLAKERAGAEFAITQLFFDADAYAAMVARFRALGGTMPIIAGIMPITVPSQIERFASLSGSGMPAAFEAQLRSVADDRARFREVGIELVTDLCRQVIAAGAPGLQFFTLNRSTATHDILSRLRSTADALPA
ncbi:MAG: methylenetetrahydrofolate reductase [Propioniciclava sp.]|uniref:methylenetetrahydrofolate reductase n=1 Tax=Propioniciclava sp. TaxID=2038686 RepID=UPI0039E57FB3